MRQVVVFLIGLFYFHSVYAADPITSAIEQAQGLALKKNRKEACAVLNRAFTATPSQIRNRGKIVESLHQVSKVFFTDKGQKLYESGQVLIYDNPDMAMTQLREALNLEDENILLLSALARAQMIKQDCDAALVSLETARTLDPHAAEPAVLELRGLLCAKRFEVFKEKIKILGSAEKWDQAFGQFLAAQEQIRLNSTHKAYDILSKITEEFPQFPESYFYLAKAGLALEKDNTPWLQKYSVLCKGVTLRERKKYGYEPLLCSHLKEADDELASKKNEN